MNRIVIRPLIAMITFLVIGTVGLIAAPLDRLPVKDVGEVAAHMIDRKHFLDGSVYSRSETGEAGQQQSRRVFNLGPGVAGVRDAIADLDFRLNVANTNDTVQTWLALYDKSDIQLFRGSATQRLRPTGTPGVYVTELVSLYMDFANDPTVEIPGVNWVDAYLIDPETGKTERVIQLEIDEDTDVVAVPRAIIGKAYYEVRYTDGTTVVYKPDGSIQSKITVHSNVEASIAHTLIIKDGDVVLDNIPSFSGYGRNKLIHLILTKEQEVGFEASTSEGHFAYGLKWRKAGPDHVSDPWEDATFENKKDGALTLEAGDWYIIFLWDKEKFQPWPESYRPPSGGGGKG